MAAHELPAAPGRAASRPRLSSLLVLILSAGLAGPAPAQTVRTWSLTGTGYWSAPANWLSAAVPDSVQEAALVPASIAACNVLLDHSYALDHVTLESPGAWLYLGGNSLTLAGAAGLASSAHVVSDGAASTLAGSITNQPGGSLRVRGGSTLTLPGPSVVNNGTIFVNDNQITAVADLVFDGNVTLAGAGDLWLYANSPWSQVMTTSGSTLTNAAGHTIHGLGRLDAQLVNAGTVNADAGNQALYLGAHDMTNTGLLEATGGGWLEVDGVRVENAGGEVAADGGGVALLPGAAIHGGTLSSSAGGALYTMGNARLEAVASQGAVKVRAGDKLTLAGPAIDNWGTITVNHNQVTAVGTLEAEGDVSLNGGGNVWLYAGSPWSQLTTAPGGRLTNAIGHVIHGFGDVYADLVNAGTVIADVGNQQLFLRGADKTNTAVLRAENGGWLTLDGVRIHNTGGYVIGDGGNVILGAGTVVEGGILATTGSNAIFTQGDARLEGVQSWGTLSIRSGDTLTVAGPTIRNTGTVRINHNQVTAIANLRFDGNVSLEGTGDVWLYAGSPWCRITTTGTAILTNAAGHTLHGFGDVYARLVNSGTVTADVGNQQLFLRGADKTNKSVMRAIGNGWLTLDGVRVDNSQGGDIRADGGNVLLANHAAVTRGALTSTGANAVFTQGGARLEGVTLRGTLNLAAGDTLTVAGVGLCNQGTVRVNHNQVTAIASLTADGNVVLTGPGDVLLYAGGVWSQINVTPGSTLTNGVGHLIHGAGTIVAPLINAGTLRADYGGNTLDATSPGFVNRGVAEAVNGAYLRLTNPAMHYAAGTFSGGTWHVIGSSTLWLEGATITASAANLLLDGAGSRVVRDGAGDDALATLGANQAGGLLTLRNGRSLATSGSFQNSGDLVIGKDCVVRVGASAAPGAGPDSPAAGEAFTQTATGTVRLEIGGRAPGQFAQLRVTGQANLGGVLAADFVDGFAPVLGDTFQVMAFGSVAGSFHHFEGAVVNGLRLFPTVYSNRVVLTALPPGVAVEEPSPAAPRALALRARLTPSGAAELVLELPAAADVSLALYDLRGRRLLVLAEGLRPAGIHRFTIGGSRADGRGLASGLYFAQAVVRSAAGEETRGARVVLLR